MPVQRVRLPGGHLASTATFPHPPYPYLTLALRPRNGGERLFGATSFPTDTGAQTQRLTAWRLTLV